MFLLAQIYNKSSQEVGDTVQVGQTHKLCHSLSECQRVTLWVFFVCFA